MFHYYHLDGSQCNLDLLGERLHANEWTAISRMGGLPSFDPNEPVSNQPHFTSNCDDTCKVECSTCKGENDDCTDCEGTGLTFKLEASGKIHTPPGVPLPYAWCAEHGSWATLVPIRPPTALTVRPKT